MRFAHGGSVVARRGNGQGLLEVRPGLFVQGQIRRHEAELKIIRPGKRRLVEALETGLLALEQAESLPYTAEQRLPLGQ
jgi:hypothetical protein